MIEINAINGTKNAESTLSELQTKLLKIDGARMHWGLQTQDLKLSIVDLQKMYPHFDDWNEVYKKLNST